MTDKDFIAARVATCTAILSLLRKPPMATAECSVEADRLYHAALIAGYKAQLVIYKAHATAMDEPSPTPELSRDPGRSC
jgi:hypothetical protein